MPRDFSRKLRVAAELQRLLNELLHSEVKDPRLAGVTVNEVELSGDLGVAKVYYGSLDPDQDPDEARAGFAKAAGFMRSRIGRSLRLRRVPELHFVHDVSAERGLELTRLIDEAAARRRDGRQEDGGPVERDDGEAGRAARDDETGRAERDDEAGRAERDDEAGRADDRRD